MFKKIYIVLPFFVNKSNTENSYFAMYQCIKIINLFSLLLSILLDLQPICFAKMANKT